jgi:glycosyltransferase involved in cell wall biosynthesis
MQVVINAAFLPALYAEEYKSFLSAAFRMIAAAHSRHQFIFVCSEQFKRDNPPSENVQYHVINSPGASVLKWKYWFDVSLPRLLNRYKADVLVAPGGFCSLTTKVPQCLIMHIPDRPAFPSIYTKLQLGFYKKYIPLFIQKAKQVCALSASAATAIEAVHPAVINKIETIYPVISHLYKPAPDEVKARIKNQYTGGREYFLFSGPVHVASNLVKLLKAFSLFKKRQQTGMKLVIASLSFHTHSSFVKSIDTYKYRDDVLLLESMSEAAFAELLSSAYALVYPVLFNGIYLPVIQAMYSHVPVIVSGSALATEIAGKSALHVNAQDEQGIADHMMRLYKDENLRSGLIAETVDATKRFDPLKSAEQLWQTIQKTTASGS